MVYHELVRICVNGEIISATPSHPFYVPKLCWTSAIKLRAGDILVLSNGEYVVVEAVQHEILETTVKVYNFEVEDFHTYFVGECSVLVHNKCRGEIVLDSEHYYERARNKAQDILGDLGADSKPLYGRMESSAGYNQVIGRKSANGKRRWRLDYDPKKGPHINVEDFSNGKGAKAIKICIPFDGDESTFISYLKHLNR